MAQTKKRSGERGIALALVLAVLVCLLSIAIPFSLSMRHEQGGVAFRSADDEARRTVASVRDLTLAHLGETAPDRDVTPWADDPAETTPDLEGAAKALGIEDVGARGRLLSAELDDQSGRIDLNRASLYLLARTLGLSTNLSRKLKADDKDIRLVDGSFLQDEGFLWIDGEVVFYRSRDGSTVSDFTRPAMVPGVWEPSKLASADPREFESGEEVLDFRAWMVAAWLFKRTPGQESRFESLTHPLAIAELGRGALGPEQRARIDRLATIWTADAGRDRFGLRTRVFDELIGGETRELRVEEGAFAGRGSLCRITTYGGKVEYNFVLRSRRVDNGFRLELEMPVTIDADPYQSVVEFLVPRPVNVNACTPEVLELLLANLRLPGQTAVDERVAKLVAQRIVAARPLAGLKTLVELLDVMVQKEKSLKDEQRMAILLNAEHSGSFMLEIGTAPFCFASDGVFDVRAAASLNFPLNGRERARAFLREVVSTTGAGVSARAYVTQRDFEEPWRITRLARGWTTHPENLQVWIGGASASNPPSRLPAMLPSLSRFPSEQLQESAARLAPGRMTVELPERDRTWHFAGGRGDLDSKDPEGWRLADGALAFNVDGQDPGVQIADSLTGGTLRPGPFGVSMWWNPGDDLGGDQTLFDWKTNARALNPELQDRVRLRFHERKLEFEVDDAFLRQSADDIYTSKIVYDFTDLPLEADTWYHVTAFCRGNRAGQMSLWIDGKPRGKYSHYTRLPSSFTASATGSSNLPIDSKRLADGVAKFPGKGVVRVGHDHYEYTSISGSALVVKYDEEERHGGSRPAPVYAVGSNSTPVTSGGGTHPAEQGVELYGYSGRLASDAPPGSSSLDPEGLPKFGVAKVANSVAKTAIDYTGGGQPFQIGMGFESDLQAIDVVQLDGEKLAGDDKTFAKNGGFALLVSHYFGATTNVYNPVDKRNEGSLESYKTSKGSWIQGVEVIWYASYGDSKLSGVVRGQGLKNTLSKTDLSEFSALPVSGGGSGNHTFHFVEPHAYILRPDPNVYPEYPEDFTVLVVPIGIQVSGSNLTKNFLLPESVSGGFDRCELMQIDSGFNSTGKDSTEWVRYDALIQDSNSRWNFLRCDPQRIAAMHDACDSPPFAGSSLQQEPNPANRLDDIALNPAKYAPSQSDYEALVELINQEDPLNWNDSNLAFRGVLGTGVSEHSGGRDIFPVFRVDMAGSANRPGRYDEVTFVGIGGERPERHIVNYAWSFPTSEDWNGMAHVALFEESLATRFPTTPGLNINTSTPTGFATAVAYQSDSRNFARIIKFPSGELPSVWDSSSQLVIGDSSGGTGGGGGAGGEGAKIDEVRIFSARDPQSIYALGKYVLRKDLPPQEEDRFEVEDEMLRFPAQYIGSLPGLIGIHQDASVWQFGDDFIVCGERQEGQPITQNIAEEGRTRFTDTPGFHAAFETGMVLPWHCMARLGKGISAVDSILPIGDGSQFPRSGYVLIDQEVLGYTDLASGDEGATLYVPTRMQEDESEKGSTSGARGNAVFRARYGTLAQTHQADAVVFFWPWRYADAYQARVDIPELASLEVPIAARRGLFHSLSWKETKGDPLASLVASVRVMGRGDFAADPVLDQDFFVFEKPGTPESPNLIDRQGDLLRVRFNVRYRDGALDPVDFSHNSWKRAPRLELVGVEYLADRVVELHEESR